jgi:hypothetical protein
MFGSIGPQQGLFERGSGGRYCPADPKPWRERIAALLATRLISAMRPRVVGLKYDVVNDALQRIYLVNDVFVQVSIVVLIRNTAYHVWSSFEILYVTGQSLGNVKPMLKYAGEAGF